MHISVKSVLRDGTYARGYPIGLKPVVANSDFKNHTELTFLRYYKIFIFVTFTSITLCAINYN